MIIILLFFIHIRYTYILYIYMYPQIDHKSIIENHLRGLSYPFVQVLGPNHFYVATTLDCIANLKDGAGQVEEAPGFIWIWQDFWNGP